MAYSTTQREARYNVGGGEGAIIKMWYRRVQLDGQGQPDVMFFSAECEEDTGQPRCDMIWKPSVNSEGMLVQTYTCEGVTCEGGECVLEYSENGDEWLPVTDEEPPATQNCFFRCSCSEQS